MADGPVRFRDYEAAGVRVLEHSVFVTAPVERVWRAYTTSEGLMDWAAPFAVADFDAGTLESGWTIESHAGDPANMFDRYVAFIPQRMVAWRTERLPPGAPFDVSLWMQLHQVAEFAQRDGGTDVTQSLVGVGRGGGWDALAQARIAGNDWALRMLRKAMASGPLDWRAELKG